MLTVCLFIIILTAEAYALRLNEIEANPEGDDSGFEWVELYSAESVSLEGYVLDHNSSGGPVNLSGSFQGLFIITFPSQWLRNTNEVIYLKLNENVIDTAGPFTDNKKNKTYSFCNTWIFIADSRNAENACSSSSGSGGTQTQTQIQNQSRQSSNTEEREEEIPRTTIEQNNNLEDNNQNNIINLADDIPIQKPKKIFLNGKTTDKNIDVEVTKTYKTRVGVIYFFIALCVLLVVLIASRKL
ncbi:hypothetical protein J4423_00920 [Candidatus Pacearchaeota archaeon]|nr:hypothetical protein [Candidatus Pacearchaeota archaeon]